jgi:hypothetical protein
MDIDNRQNENRENDSDCEEYDDWYRFDADRLDFNLASSSQDICKNSGFLLNESILLTDICSKHHSNAIDRQLLGVLRRVAAAAHRSRAATQRSAATGGECRTTPGQRR